VEDEGENVEVEDDEAEEEWAREKEDVDDEADDKMGSFHPSYTSRTWAPRSSMPASSALIPLILLEFLAPLFTEFASSSLLLAEQLGT
jgi:hypothetical protein